MIGASGFIGSRVVSALASTSWAIPVAGIRRSLGQLPLQVATTPVDITDPASVAVAITGVDSIVNCMSGPAAQSAAGAEVVFSAASRALNPPLVVHLSSMAVYGSAIGNIAEDASLLGDLGPYSTAKVQAEQSAGQHRRTVVLRPGCVYGPGSTQWSERVARWLVEHRLGDIGASGDGFCNLVHVDDVVAAILRSLQRQDVEGHAFNLSLPDPPTWNQYLVAYGLALGATPIGRIGERRLKFETKVLSPLLKVIEIVGSKRGFGRRWPAIPPSLLSLMKQEIRLDVAKAEHSLEMNWKPLDAGLRETARWFAECSGRSLPPK